MGSYDQFFDEDGNILTTQRDIDMLKKQEEQAKKDAEEAQKKEVRSLERDLAMDKKSQELSDLYEKDKQRQREQEEWMRLPEWIKMIKTIPLDDPPTEGKKEKLLYTLTKRVELTDNERKRREKMIHLRDQAIDDHEKITRELPENSPLCPVTVISTSRGAGGSSITRCISDALQMSREGGSACVSIDLSGADSELFSFFRNTPPRMNMRNFLRSYLTEHRNVPPAVILPKSETNQQEFFLENSDSVSRRMEPSVKDVANIYSALRDMEGFILFDCDTQNMGATCTAMLLSNTIVFAVDPLQESMDNVTKTINEYKKFVENKTHAMNVLNHVLIVLTAQDKRLMTRDNLVTIKKMLNNVCDTLGMDHDRGHIIPYDKALSVHPFSIRGARLSTAHRIRSIVSIIVNDAIMKYS